MTKNVLLIRFLVFFGAGGLFLFPGEAKAEFECGCDILFKVKSGAKSEGGQPEAGAGVPAADEGREVFFAAIRSLGADEETARSDLKKKIDISKEKAIAQCRTVYENKSTCIATKYSTMEAVINTLDFKARDELQKAIRSDCDKQAGTCVEAKATEAVCRDVSAAAAEGAKPEGEEAAKGAEAGKDAKGGGEKKK